MPTKKSNKYDNTRYVDWAIKVTKPAKKPRSTAKKKEAKDAKK